MIERVLEGLILRGELRGLAEAVGGVLRLVEAGIGHAQVVPAVAVFTAEFHGGLQ